MAVLVRVTVTVTVMRTPEELKADQGRTQPPSQADRDRRGRAAAVPRPAAESSPPMVLAIYDVVGTYDVVRA